MHLFRATWALVLVAGLALTGCPPPSSPCESAADCLFGQTCTDGECRNPAGPTPGARFDNTDESSTSRAPDASSQTTSHSSAVSSSSSAGMASSHAIISSSSEELVSSSQTTTSSHVSSSSGESVSSSQMTSSSSMELGSSSQTTTSSHVFTSSSSTVLGSSSIIPASSWTPSGPSCSSWTSSSSSGLMSSSGPTSHSSAGTSHSQSGTSAGEGETCENPSLVQLPGSRTITMELATTNNDVNLWCNPGNFPDVFIQLDAASPVDVNITVRDESANLVKGALARESGPACPTAWNDSTIVHTCQSNATMPSTTALDMGFPMAPQERVWLVVEPSNNGPASLVITISGS